ncbi:MAG TPA: sulfur carrier protein ThiS [Pyrinomonadaceae bacterium]|nr:sulfur carrier protein ThiS [Pyrinomonadaceae bacterium]
MSKILITLNGEQLPIAGDIDLETLISQLALPAKRLAVEMNGNVIRRIDWPQTTVSDGDRIEVVHFVGGG